MCINNAFVKFCTLVALPVITEKKPQCTVYTSRYDMWSGSIQDWEWYCCSDCIGYISGHLGLLALCFCFSEQWECRRFVKFQPCVRLKLWHLWNCKHFPCGKAATVGDSTVVGWILLVAWILEYNEAGNLGTCNGRNLEAFDRRPNFVGSVGQFTFLRDAAGILLNSYL